MDIQLLTIGKTTSAYINKGIEEYLKRLKRYIPYEIIELADAKKSGKVSQSEQKEAEADILLKRIAENDLVILLDERGKEYTSREFAEYLRRTMTTGRKRLIFVVGGPYGFSQRIYDRADGLISLSKMTFNHEMVRLFFTEQIYRGIAILNGLPYHHD